MTILTTAVIAALAAQSAFAERRANKPFSTANGRTTATAPAPAPRVITVNTPGGGAAANVGPAITSAMGNTGGYAFTGGGNRTVSRVSGGSRRGGGKAFWGNRKIDGGGAVPAPAPAPAEEAPAHFSKPGALIRTTGQAPVYEKAETARTHTVEAGPIVLSKHKMFDVGKGPSVHIGPKDTPPPPNPGTGGGYGTGATANSGPSGSSGSGNGNNNGHNNNGSGNNDKNKPGDDFDDHGGVSTDLVGDSVNAAF